MPTKPHHYRKALAGSDIPPPARAVAMALAARANTHTGACWPSVATLALDLGITARSVRRHLATLEAAGWLTRSARYDGGVQRSNVYRLAVPGAVTPDSTVTPDRPVTPDSAVRGGLTVLSGGGMTALSPRTTNRNSLGDSQGDAPPADLAALLDELGIRRTMPR